MTTWARTVCVCETGTEEPCTEDVVATKNARVVECKGCCDYEEKRVMGTVP